MFRERLGRHRTSRLWARLGLRARVTVMFGLGALLFSASMGLISYLVVRHVLVDERESLSLSLAERNAASAHGDLTALDHTLSKIKTHTTAFLEHQDIDALLTDADAGATTSHSVVEWRDKWFPNSLTFTTTAISSGIRSLVDAGRAATQTYVYRGQTIITIGVPLRHEHAAFFEIFVVDDLDHTLSVVAVALFSAGVVTTLIGALVGRWASGRSLRPLTGVSRAAVAIAGGQLDTRLAVVAGDPDLEGLTASFNRMVDQLQERIEREARFTSDVSHELRSPLTTMAASLEVMESHTAELSSTGRRALGLLSADLRRFQRMVGELLEISRSDAGSADVWLEEVDPEELTRRAVAAAARSLPPEIAPPQIIVDPALDGVRLSVDKRRFERVLTNLIENAAAYGGGATTVHVAAGSPPAALVNGSARSRMRVGRTRPRIAGNNRGAPPEVTSVLFSVNDHGPGIPMAERGRIFQRFYRGQASGQRGAGSGTGLGLALVAEHVRVHGGRVWVDDAEGGGARFNVEFPAFQAQDGDEDGDLP